MAEPFIGQIRMFAGNFAPRSYAFCQGQLLSIAQNQALFAILGTTFGGNGINTFALPNLTGRMPMGWGNGPGLSNRMLGEALGQDTATVTLQQLPAHAHGMRASAAAATTNTPSAGVSLAATSGAKVYHAPTNPVTSGAPLLQTGGSQPHENRQPHLGVNFIIALQGVFPSRN